MTTELVTVTIDGAQVQVPKGTPIIEAAKQAGVLVPHYCYHPSLPSPAVCRMCLVEVEKAPKLVPACVTTVADGQVIHVQSPKACEARESVLEFLLINHPLDCPVCDQAGECELQNYVFQEGRSGTRYSDYAKRFNPVEDFGPDILYVPNRCILCTRCVRFMDAVAEDPVLNVSERGDRAYIGIDPDALLTHPWSGNVVDLCPVGSLISKDFLHKARAWDLDKTSSICPGCSQGCNITIDTRDDVVVRLRPRPNLDVNRHFICDHGRSDYRWMNRGDRVEAPLVRAEGRVLAVDWDQALDRVAQLCRAAQGRGPVVVLASGRSGTESLGLLAYLVDGLDATRAVLLPEGEEAPLPGIPNLALRRERAPNGTAARWLGYTADWQAALRATRGAALTIVLDLPGDEALERALREADHPVIVCATRDEAMLELATLTLPVTTMAEEQGTYVNRDGRVQRYWPAKGAPGMARPAWWVAAGAAARLQGGEPIASTADEAFAVVADRIPALHGLRYPDLGYTGRLAAAPAAAVAEGR